MAEVTTQRLCDAGPKPRVVAGGAGSWWVRAVWDGRPQLGPSWACFPTWRAAIEAALAAAPQPPEVTT